MPKSLVDIIPPSRREAMGIRQNPANYDAPIQRPEKGGFPYYWLIGSVIIIALCIGAMIVFRGAEVHITPRIQDTSIQAPLQATPSVGELPYETISVEKIVSQKVTAEGTETATVAAQGTITVYNTQSKKQELIKNTRFETPDGHIFRIHESVSVPAGTTDAPGTLKVTVYADAAGQEYNTQGATTFTLPGLKGSALYTSVYGKSESGMTGGFSGTRPSVTVAVRNTQQKALEKTLATDLEKMVIAKVKEGYVLLPGAIQITYEAQPDSEGTSGTVELRYKGVATATVFPNNALASAIAKQVIAKYDGEPIQLKNVDSLQFAKLGEESVATGTPVMTFSLSGTTSLQWLIPVDEVKDAIAGKTRNAANTIVKGIPGVETSSIILRPFWESMLPTEPSQIKIVERKPKED